MGNRKRRLGQLLRQEISELITRGIKDPRIAFVSITSVDVAPDLRHAKVYISVLGTERQRKSTIIGLRNASGYIRSELAARLSLRYAPEIRIMYDDSIEEGSRILALIDSVSQGEDEEGEEDQNEDHGEYQGADDE